MADTERYCPAERRSSSISRAQHRLSLLRSEGNRGGVLDISIRERHSEMFSGGKSIADRSVETGPPAVVRVQRWLEPRSVVPTVWTLAGRWNEVSGVTRCHRRSDSALQSSKVAS